MSVVTLPAAGTGRSLHRLARGAMGIWALTAAVAGAALALGLGFTGGLHPPLRGSLALDLTLVAVFAAAEIFVVHVKFYRETQTFSLSEIGLVMGLFFAPPWVLVLAHLVGGGLALVLHRRQHPVKLAFNLANFSLSTTAAVVVFHAVGHLGNPLGLGWLAALAAVMAFTVVGVLTVFAAIAISDGSSARLDPTRNLLFGSLSASVTGSFGLITVAVMRVHPAAVALLVLPVAGLYLANRAYLKEREKNESLRFLYDSTRLLNQSPELTSAVASMLAQARETVGADVAALVHLPNDGGRLLQHRVGPGLETGLMAEVDLDGFAPLWELADGATSVRFDARPGGGAEVVAALLPGVELRDGWVVPLRGEHRINGALVVANHLRAVGSFSTGDVRMLETLAGHLSIALENGRLEQSLAELRLLQERLTFQATHDSLTGLPNRVLFSETTTAALEALAAAGAPDGAGAPDPAGVPAPGGGAVGVLFVDLDDFKTVNDSLGHAAGDELLAIVTRRIASCLRVGDFAARLGGDEFAVLVPLMRSTASAARVAERIIDSLSSPVNLTAGQVRVNASIGMAVSVEGDTAESLMRNADMAMYAAKGAGKARWAVFSPDMHEAVLRRRDLTQDMLTGIAEGQLEVHMQPMVDLHTGRLLAAEALVRWNHPRFGPLSPDDFIPVAEESGHISVLTRFVLNDACRQAVAWRTPEGIPWDGTVSVNLSARDFDDAGLVDMVSAALERSGLEPARLMLEITETLMLNDPVASAVQLEGLAGLGVHIALDDFGTGYSSLSQLGRLPLGWVKIAKPFVDAIGHEARGEALVRAIVEMGSALDVRVIAEGIETPDQLARLQSFGCDVGQGFHIGRPLGEAAWTAWLDGRLRGAAAPPVSIPPAGLPAVGRPAVGLSAADPCSGVAPAIDLAAVRQARAGAALALRRASEPAGSTGSA